MDAFASEPRLRGPMSHMIMFSDFAAMRAVATQDIDDRREPHLRRQMRAHVSNRTTVAHLQASTAHSEMDRASSVPSGSANPGDTARS